MQSELPEEIKDMIANGMPAWEQQKAREEALKTENFNDFVRATQKVVGPLQAYAQWKDIRKQWPYKKPTVGTTQEIGIMAPMLSFINIRLVFTGSLVYSWKSDPYPTQEDGFCLFKVLRISGDFYYCNTLEIALAAAKDAFEESVRKMEVHSDYFTSFMDAVKKVPKPPMPKNDPLWIFKGGVG